MVWNVGTFITDILIFGVIYYYLHVFDYHILSIYLFVNKTKPHQLFEIRDTIVIKSEI